MQRQLVVIAHNLRSTHNVGSLLRTAEGLGVSKVYLTGYTPYPQHDKDSRLPHQSLKITHQIHKTALGAENYIVWEHVNNIENVILALRQQHYTIVALEQTTNAKVLHQLQVPQRLALIIGREVEGLEAAVLKQADQAVMIPMLGRKESFNVIQAAAMALYYCRFVS